MATGTGLHQHNVVPHCSSIKGGASRDPKFNGKVNLLSDDKRKAKSTGKTKKVTKGNPQALLIIMKCRCGETSENIPTCESWTQSEDTEPHKDDISTGESWTQSKGTEPHKDDITIGECWTQSEDTEPHNDDISTGESTTRSRADGFNFIRALHYPLLPIEV